ncbi:MAG: hypothetical protein E7370_04245 [Clostridiales bacterium]|nr:hypothetical protein [Clostridiales bacterium]
MLDEKTKKFCIALICVFLSLFFALVCAFSMIYNQQNNGAQSSISKNCKVIIQDNECFNTLSNTKVIKRGEDASFSLTFKNGYTFNGVNYKDYDYEVTTPNANGERTVNLTFKNVKYSVGIEVDVKEINKLYQVSVNNSRDFYCEEMEKTVEEGGDVIFKIHFEEDIVFDGCNYQNYEYSAEEDYGILTLKNVNSSLRLNILTKLDTSNIPILPSIPKGAAGITYMLNGGKMIDGSDDTYYHYIRSIDLYPRFNVENSAFKIERDGYVQTGWNTEEDGSGTHISFGSRVTVVENESIILYAEWSKCNPEQDFEYVLVDREDIVNMYTDTPNSKTPQEMATESDSEDKIAVITKYKGSSTVKVTIPETLGGYEVLGIGAYAFNNCQEIKEVVLNKNINFLQDYAFDLCNNIKTLYVFDNISRLGLFYPFGKAPSVETLYINAIEPPTYGGTENGQFANKLEMLINYDSDQPKMVFYGGCSIFYALDSLNIERTFNDKYKVFNMGVIGGVCSMYQLELIYNYINEGDVFVHVPELASEYQLLGRPQLDSRVFITIENNFDLLSTINLKEYEEVFYSFNNFIVGKQKLLDTGEYDNATYVEILPDVNSYGDLTYYRRGFYNNEGSVYKYLEIDTFEKYKCADGMIKYYNAFAEKGADLYFMFSPMNNEGLEEGAGEYLVDYIFDVFESNNIPITPTMENLDAVKLPSRYFYDTNYHLSTEGVAVYTDIVIEYLRNFISA